MNLPEPPRDASDVGALRAEVELFPLLANNVPVAIAYYEASTLSCRFANRGYCTMFGFDERSIVGLTFAQVIGAEAAALIQPQVDRMLRDGVGASYEREVRAPDGSTRHVDVHLLPHLDDTGRVIGSFVLIADITPHRRTQAALRQSEERLAKFLHASAEGIVFHRNGRITDVNPPLLALLGYTLDEMLGRSTLDFVAPKERTRVAEVMAAGAEITYQSVVLHRDGSEIPVEFIVRTMRHHDEVLRMTIVRDMRDRLAAQERIHYLAHHDALTGLPNRHSFIERVEALIPQAEARGGRFALVFIDLDHFKRVNDSLGHLAGDALLKAVAGRITASLRSTDVVARFGGDEFVVLLADEGPPQAVREVAEKLLRAVAEPLVLDGSPIAITPSIGVSLFPRHGRTPDELIRHADAAMYDAKLGGRATFRLFEPAMVVTAQQALDLERRLEQAIRERQFVMYFQPQRALSDGTVAGVEALIRWQHPERGLLEPGAFVPMAEARRLMPPIGEWVLDEALRWAVRWHGAGLLRAPVAVNLSVLQLELPDFVTGIERALARHGAPGALLELELSERMLVDGIPDLPGTLARLKALGLSIALDDFGTGYTSLGHLKDLPIDRLKLDRSYVEELAHDPKAAAIAEAIVQLAHSLGQQVVAEGVETPEQAAWLAARRCHAVQGYLHARPMPAERFEAWLSGRT